MISKVNIRRSYWIPGSYAPTWSEKRTSLFKAIEKEGLQGEKGDNNWVVRQRQIHDPGIQQEPLSLARVPNVRREMVAVDALVASIADEHQPRLAAQGVTLHLEGLQALGQVALHRFTFRRALLNLVANALDAMPDGGHLTRAGQRTASHLIVSVQDTGEGMSAEQLPQLFTPLYTTKANGTGLGLYVVQEIVKAHRGTVDVTSTRGAGTTFTLRLPLAPADAQPTP